MNGAHLTIKLLRPYILALLFTSVATGLRIWPLDVLGDRFIWSSFYSAVVLSAIYGGLYPGLLSTLLSCLVCYVGWQFFSGHSFKQDNAGWVGMMVFVFNGILISVVAEVLRRSRERNAKASKALEEKIAQLNALSNNLPDSFIYQAMTNGAGIPEMIYVSDGIKKFADLDGQYGIRDPLLLYQLIPEEERQLFLDERNRAAREVRQFRTDIRYRKKDGTTGWASVHSKPRKNDDGINVWDGLFTDITTRVLLEKELNRQQLRSQQLLTELAIQEHENEKNQVSYELHEQVNQLLAAAKMHLELSESKNHADDAVATSIACISQAMQKINVLFESVDFPAFNLCELPERIELLASDLLEENDHPVQVNLDKEAVKGLPEKMKLLLYRIIKNRFIYIRDHTDPCEVNITVEAGSDVLRLDISYTVGDCDPNRDKWSIDLRTIYSRVEFYGGATTISRGKENSCVLQISLPLSIVEME